MYATLDLGCYYSQQRLFDTACLSTSSTVQGITSQNIEDAYSSESGSLETIELEVSLNEKHLFIVWQHAVEGLEEKLRPMPGRTPQHSCVRRHPPLTFSDPCSHFKHSL